MTSAHRPTFYPARGSENGGYLASVPSRAISGKDMPGHTKLKYRTTEQSDRNLKEELEERERKASSKRERDETKLIEDAEEERVKRRKTQESSAESGEEVQSKEEVQVKQEPSSDTMALQTRLLDEDDTSGESSSDVSSSSDDEDEAAELQRELERIRRERQMEKERQRQLQEQVEEEERTRALLQSNPLLNNTGDYSLKKKWYEDVVFRNQAKGEPTYQKRFINDTIRNDFHRRFINKYVK